MHPAVSYSQSGQWLLDGGIRQVELLFRAIIYPPAEPILIADDERYCRDASCGTGKLLGLARDRIIGRKIDEFAEPGSRPQIAEDWHAFLQKGEQPGRFRLIGADGAVQDVEYTAKRNVLPGRHALTLRENKLCVPDGPASVRDFAVFLFDPDGDIVSWYGGAERVYGYRANEIVGQPVSRLYAGKDFQPGRLDEELKRAAAQGHFGIERWNFRKDRTRFWANVLTMALRSPEGELQGFARVVRDFSDRHAADEKLLSGGVQPVSGRPPESTIAGVVSGEFDHILEANDAFLQMVGYTREDLATGQLYWPNLTPAEYSRLDELAHEEALRYGACTPFEKEYVRKDGTRVRVLATFAVLNLSPFHWNAIVHVPVWVEGGERVADDPGDGGTFDEIVGRSVEMKRVLKLVETVAPTDATVLILGETGTGKELVARAVHRLSHRKNFPFVTLNCAAIPTGLLESELFGYERGAFTGALTQKLGRFEMANRGTLFLDEVGDIPLDLQPKLLRALQEKAFERLGGTKTIPIDIRLVAATNRNLTQMMAEKHFRSDLYYRLKVFPITTPPLRDRPDDIPALAHYFVRKYSREMEKHIQLIPAETMRALVSWPWPGNVRELENFMERSVILSTGSTLHAPLGELRADDLLTTGTLEEMEREFIVRAVREANGVITTAATRLGIPRTTLNAMMQKLGISRKDV
jgi:PAS domain S-box-containing protein